MSYTIPRPTRSQALNTLAGPYLPAPNCVCEPAPMRTAHPHVCHAKAYKCMLASTKRSRQPCTRCPAPTRDSRLRSSRPTHTPEQCPYRYSRTRGLNTEHAPTLDLRAHAPPAPVYADRVRYILFTLALAPESHLHLSADLLPQPDLRIRCISSGLKEYFGKWVLSKSSRNNSRTGNK